MLTKAQCLSRLKAAGITGLSKRPVAELRERVAQLESHKVLREPGALSDVKAVRGSTKRAALIKALATGKTLDQLSRLLGWSRDVCSGALYADVVSAGYGLAREGNVYRLILPQGLRAPAITREGESRGDALKAACR